MSGPNPGSNIELDADGVRPELKAFEAMADELRHQTLLLEAQLLTAELGDPRGYLKGGLREGYEAVQLGKDIEAALNDLFRNAIATVTAFEQHDSIVGIQGELAPNAVSFSYYPDDTGEVDSGVSLKKIKEQLSAILSAIPSQVTGRIDAFIYKQLILALGKDIQAAKESVNLHMKGAVDLKLSGIPLPLRVGAGENIKITRDLDGTILVMLRVEVEGGVDSKEAILKDVKGGEILFRYDPKKDRDITELALLLALQNTAVAGGFTLLSRDHVVGVRGDVALTGHFKSQLGPSLKLTGQAGIAWERNRRGEEVITHFAGLSGEGTSLPIKFSEEIKGSLELAQISNRSTSELAVKATVRVELGESTPAGIVEELRSYLPSGAKIDFSAKGYAGIRLEYTLDQPWSTARDIILTDNGRPAVDVLRNASHIKVIGSVKVRTEVGTSSVTPLRKIIRSSGFEVNAGREVESEHVLYEKGL